MTAGLVVAGGYSTRFGLAEKPLVEVGGEPMLARVVRALDPVVDDVVIDCRADQVAPFETALAEVAADPRYAPDDDPDRGPIAGIACGLREIDAAETIVLSCDRPGVSATLLVALRALRRRFGAAVAVPSVDGHVQPLCGVYRTGDLRNAVDDALARDERRLRSIPHELSGYVVPERGIAEVADPAAIRSVDSALEARLWRSGEDRAGPGEDPTAPTDGPRRLAGD